MVSKITSIGENAHDDDAVIGNVHGAEQDDSSVRLGERVEPTDETPSKEQMKRALALAQASLKNPNEKDLSHRMILFFRLFIEGKLEKFLDSFAKQSPKGQEILLEFVEDDPEILEACAQNRQVMINLIQRRNTALQSA